MLVESPDQVRRQQPEGHTGQRADQAHQHRLGDELRQDIALARPDRLAHADLARALGDADEHDVHDADATDQQRDRGNHEQEDLVRLLRVLRRLQLVLLVHHLPVRHAVSGAMLPAQRIIDLTDRRTHAVRARAR